MTKSWENNNTLKRIQESGKTEVSERTLLAEDLQEDLNRLVLKARELSEELDKEGSSIHYDHDSGIGYGKDGGNVYRFFSTERSPFKSFKSFLAKYVDRFGPESTLVKDSDYGEWLDIAGDVAAVTNSPSLRNITKTSTRSYEERLEEDLDRVEASDEERREWREAMRREFLQVCEHMRIYTQYIAWENIVFYLKQAQDSIKGEVRNLKSLK